MDTQHIKQPEQKAWDIYVVSFLRDFQLQKVNALNKNTSGADLSLFLVTIALHLVVPALLGLCILNFSSFLGHLVFSILKEIRIR
jgi:hypothetical protein